MEEERRYKCHPLVEQTKRIEGKQATKEGPIEQALKCDPAPQFNELEQECVMVELHCPHL